MLLTQLSPGMRAKITRAQVPLRLKELGFCAGNEITLLRRGALLEAEILGAHMAIRKADARRIEVEPCGIARR